VCHLAGYFNDPTFDTEVAKGHIMNKLTKGAIAGAAGIALLLGGAGTFALWNGTTGVTGGNVTAGTLAFTTSSATATPWTDTSVTPNTTSATAPLMVPGDTFTYTQTVGVTGTGKNLRATLALDPSTLGIPTDLSVATAPSTTIPVTVSMAITPLTGTATVSGNVISFGSTAASTFTVVVTVKFDSSTAGVLGQGETVALSNAKLLLTQVRPA
jgi:alternate signal-mediated exported protein